MPAAAHRTTRIKPGVVGNLLVSAAATAAADARMHKARERVSGGTGARGVAVVVELEDTGADDLQGVAAVVLRHWPAPGVGKPENSCRVANRVTGEE